MKLKMMAKLSARLACFLVRFANIAFSTRHVRKVVRWLIGFSCLLASGASMADSVWTTGGSLNAGRLGHTATLLLNGKVLVAGGMSDQTLASAELYDPATNAWIPVAAMNTSRWGHTASLLLDGKVLIVGGYTFAGGPTQEGSVLASAEIYDPTSNSWKLARPMITPRSWHTTTLLADGKLLVAGGETSATTGVSPILASVEMYDPSVDAWTAVAPLAMGRYSHTATLLPNAKVLVAGGQRETIPSTSVDSEVFDLVRGIWTSVGALSQSRYLHTATSLLDGKVLVVGGFGSSGLLASAEQYDLATNFWTNAGSLATARANHTATRLPNGSVLIAGGFSNLQLSTLNSAERFDPVTQTWAATAPLSTPRERHTATLLPNGKVLVTGGLNNDGVPLASAELFETGYAGTTARVAQFASRATVTPLQSVYGAFVLVDPAKLFIAVRGPSLGVLGVSSNPHPHPYLNLYTGSGQLVASSNQCAGSTADNAAVVSFYRDVRQQALSTNDACLGYVTSALPAGIYTFYIVPDPSVPSSSGEVLFEVTPAQ